MAQAFWLVGSEVMIASPISRSSIIRAASVGFYSYKWINRQWSSLCGVRRGFAKQALIEVLEFRYGRFFDVSVGGARAIQPAGFLALPVANGPVPRSLVKK